MAKNFFTGFIYTMDLKINKLNKIIYPIITAAALTFPLKTAVTTYKQAPDIIIENPRNRILPPNGITPKDLEGLTVVTDTNFAGGISHHFDNESVKKLKSRISKPDTLLEFKAPIEKAPNIYLEPFGYFFANRPNGTKKRPHMGLDIYISPYSRKPKNPVLIQAPVDGVIISHKRARKEDNIIGNCVILLGRDGRRYAFDHMARPDDYSDSIPMPTVGTIMKAGAPIGYAGSTGETTMWHLHLTVMTDEALEKQKNSKYWQAIASQAGYSALRGQVNPLNRKEAGPIADFLSQYRGGNYNLKGDFKLDEE